MDIESIYRRYGIPTAPAGHKHNNNGWVNCACPFHHTPNPGFHLGYNIRGDYFSCFSCGGHGTIESLEKILRVNKNTAFALLKEFGGINTLTKEDKPLHVPDKPFKLPLTVKPTARHLQYLIGRGFDVEKLIKKWNLQFTGVSAILDGTDYKHRILIPVEWNNQIVTFQARDITGKHKLKYIACNKAREIIHHKHILYGNQAKWSDLGIIVEGVVDVWKLGYKAAATFGIEYKSQQVREIAKNFKRVVVLYDEEPQAQAKAKKLIKELQFRNVEAIHYTIQGDPGELSVIEARHLVKELSTYKIK